MKVINIIFPRNTQTIICLRFYSTRVRQRVLVGIDYFSLFCKDLAFVVKWILAFCGRQLLLLGFIKP